MLIKGQDIRNIKGGEKEANTLKYDCFENQKMRFVIMNPPFGTPWGGKDAPDGQEKSVKDEYNKGFDGRFGAGLPATTDAQLYLCNMQLINFQLMVELPIYNKWFTVVLWRNNERRESDQKVVIRNDYIEAIIGLPNQLFYNTDIGIYIFIISKNKRKDRKGKVQIKFNAVDMYKPLRKITR